MCEKGVCIDLIIRFSLQSLSLANPAICFAFDFVQSMTFHLFIKHQRFHFG